VKGGYVGKRSEVNAGETQVVKENAGGTQVVKENAGGTQVKRR